MAVAIRLQRHGAKKHPYYHIVVIDSRLARDSGNIIERVGSYDPMLPRDSGARVKLDNDKVTSWLAKGAQPSDRVYKFLVGAGLKTAKPIPVQTKKDKPSEKTLLKLKDRETKLAKIREAEESAKAAAAAPVAEPEVVAEVVSEPDVVAEVAAESAE